VAIRVDDVDLTRDRVLVERFQAGDTEAFDELYRRYRSRLERFCLKRLGDHHAAEEVAQEAFTRALTAMPQLDGERRFYPWVSVIAARLCIDHYRRLARTELAPALEDGRVDGGQEAIVAAVDTDMVCEALDRLGPRHREVLDLREMQGLSYQAIADHYGVSIGTVEGLLFRARRALRREFQAVGGGRLASIPVVGWLIRSAAKVRDGSGSRIMLGGTAAAAALAVGLAVIPGSGGAAGGSVHTVTNSTAVAGTVRSPTATTAAPTANSPALPAGPRRGNEAGPSSAAAAPSAAPNPLSRVLVSPAQARQEISQMPIQVHMGPIDIGLDPTGQLNHVIQELQGVGK
jgi:RNA polymerase sigma factor (sigma-70 family)